MLKGETADFNLKRRWKGGVGRGKEIEASEESKCVIRFPLFFLTHFKLIIKDWNLDKLCEDDLIFAAWGIVSIQYDIYLVL